MINKKTTISYELCLDDNDWNEINQALLELAKRRVISDHTLSEEIEWWNPWDDLFPFLEENLGISFAKEIRTLYEENDVYLDEIVGFDDVIKEIDKKVDNYIKNNNIQLKASDFKDFSAFENWTDKFIEDELVKVLWEAVSSNQDNPLADKIISELGKKIG